MSTKTRLLGKMTPLSKNTPLTLKIVDISSAKGESVVILSCFCLTLMGSMKYKTDHTMLSCFRKVSFQVFWNRMIPPTKHLEFGLVWQYKEPQQSSDIGRRNAKKMWKTLSVGNNRDLHCKDESESYGFTIIKEIPASGCQGLVVITEISFLLIAGNFTANVDLIDHFSFGLVYTRNGPCTEKTKNNNT